MQIRSVVLIALRWQHFPLNRSDEFVRLLRESKSKNLHRTVSQVYKHVHRISTVPYAAIFSQDVPEIPCTSPEVLQF